MFCITCHETFQPAASPMKISFFFNFYRSRCLNICYYWRWQCQRSALTTFWWWHRHRSQEIGSLSRSLLKNYWVAVIKLQLWLAMGLEGSMTTIQTLLFLHWTFTSIVRCESICSTHFLASVYTVFRPIKKRLSRQLRWWSFQHVNELANRFNQHRTCLEASKNTRFNQKSRETFWFDCGGRSEHWSFLLICTQVQLSACNNRWEIEFISIFT